MAKTKKRLKEKPASFEGIRLNVIGDSNLFAPIGKSMGYAIEYGGSFYLVDIGAPPFYPLGAEKIESMKGIICTHSHEDHRRWFTDLALYLKYQPGVNRRPDILLDPGLSRILGNLVPTQAILVGHSEHFRVPVSIDVSHRHIMHRA